MSPNWAVLVYLVLWGGAIGAVAVLASAEAVLRAYALLTGRRPQVWRSDWSELRSWHLRFGLGEGFASPEDFVAFKVQSKLVRLTV